MVKNIKTHILPLFSITLIGGVLQFLFSQFTSPFGLQNTYIFIGLCALLFSFLRTLYGPEKMQDILLKKNIATQLVWLAFLTALGTLIPPQEPLHYTDIHRSPVYILSLGYMCGMMLAYLCYNSALYKGFKRLGILCSHIGALIIIVASAGSFTFKTKGMIDLNVGSETSVFQERVGNTLLPKFHNMGATLKLEDFKVSWSDPKVRLRLYKNNMLEQSYSPSETTQLHIDDIEITNKQYFSHLYERIQVNDVSTTAQAGTETAEAALKFTLQFEDTSIENYLIANSKTKGFISSKEGFEELVFSVDKNVKRKDGTMYISARPLSFANGLSPWAQLELPTTFVRGQAHIIVEEIHPYAHTEEILENDFSKPLNPAMQLHVKTPNYEHDIWLSPHMKDLQPLNKDWGIFLAIKEKEPTHFISTLSVLEEGETNWRTHTLEVNKPLTFGTCRVYQGSYDRNNEDFSGLQITCDPGRTGVKVGIWLMLFGTLVLMIRRRLFKGETE